MRSLAQPEVLRSAAIAASISGLVCYPRFALWVNRPFPIWYLEAVLLLGGTVLWAFVFGWHTKYTGRPVFTLKLDPLSLLLASAAGLSAAALLYFFVDPQQRLKNPNEYPANL